MIFSRLEFVLFFALVCGVAWRLRRKRSRNAWLLGASYYFYAYWDVRFCALLLFSTTVDFLLARWMADAVSPARRKLWLTASLAINLGVLGFFKYANFFIDSAAQLFGRLELHPGTLSIVLPVGISFFTFQTMSYTIDVYRRRIEPAKDFLDFALYVAFFPQLVAGPIVRASECLPQLQRVPQWSDGRFYGGFSQFLRGAVKKVLLADRMAEMVDVVWEGPQLYAGTTLAIASVAYAGQIYLDFSGYTDMAIGVAKMLGYRFPKNFRHPYLATSIADFWHRWHMTLSRWLRDYLYIPLGGNRLGRVRTNFNLLATMTLGGLWHGAAWTFVVWGAGHGIALIAHRDLSRWHRAVVVPMLGQIARGTAVPIVGWAATMAVVWVGWIFFRSDSFAQASTILGRIFGLAEGIVWYPPLPILAISLLIAEHTCYFTRMRLWFRMSPGHPWTPALWIMVIYALMLYSPRGFQPFVYFQF